MATSSETVEGTVTTLNPQRTATPPAPASTRKILQNEHVQRVAFIFGAAIAIINARLIALVATLVASGLFGYAVYEPLRERTIVAALFAALVLAPILWFYSRRGRTSDGQA